MKPPLIEAGGALVEGGGVGGVGAGPPANDLSADNNPASTNNKHAPITFFIMSEATKLISCHTKKREWKPPIVSRN